MSNAAYHELFPLGADDASYRRLTGDHVSVGMFEGRRIVKVGSDALTLLAAQAFVDSAHLVRSGHLAQLRAILDDPEASANDKFVAFDLLKNANIAAGRVLPMCQDTGTAIVMGKKGQQIWTEGDDAAALSAGIRRSYTEANRYGQAYRDRGFEEEVLELTRRLGIGAQFGGKYFCHDVRVIRLPRHGASLPIGIGVSCSADRQILGKITAEGVFLEQLETNPARFFPEIDDAALGGEVVPIDLARPMDEIRRTLSQYPIKTRLSLTGPLIVARDIAHAKLQERLDRGEGLPDYVKNHPIYYAGPAKTPAGYASGSFGPTTAGRMDSYVDAVMAAGGSFVP